MFTTKPSLVGPMFIHVVGSIELRMKLQLPSPRQTLTPPVWRLRAEKWEPPAPLHGKPFAGLFWQYAELYSRSLAVVLGG